MLVVVDMGNTNITMGLYKEDTLIGNYRLTTKLQRTSDEYGFMILSFLQAYQVTVEDIKDVIISSVVPKIMYSFTNSIRKYFHKEPIIVGPGVKTGISIKYDNPRSLGSWAARFDNISADMPIPGAMAPPINSPLEEITSKVVAVPKSITRQAQWWL